MTNEKIIAVIPARGGSKRVPKKNIIDFMGKPMIAWTIEAALKSGIFTKVLVSTDCEDIAKISRMYGAEVPFLRDANSDDYTPVSEATIGAVNQAENYWEEKFDIVIQLMANCPLRNEIDIIKAYETFISKKINFQLSCCDFSFLNPWWAFKFNSENKISYIHQQKMSQRSQDLETLYCPTGALWIADKTKLLESGTFYGLDHEFFRLDFYSSVDIDNYEDLELAKRLFNER